MWPSYQPLVKPVFACDDMDCAMLSMVAMVEGEPEDASAVPDTAARPATSKPAISRPTCLVPLGRRCFTRDIKFPPVARRAL